MITEEENQQADMVSVPVSKPKRGSIWRKLFMLLLCLFLGFGGYQSWKWHHAVQDLHANLKALKTEQQHTAMQLDSTVKHVQDIESHRDLLDKQVNAVMQHQSVREDDLLLLKVRHYLELAQLNAAWSDDTALTSNLLTQADTVLASLHGEPINALRRAIAQENALVKGTEKVDVIGLLSQLNAAQALSNTLIPRSLAMSISQDNLEKTETKATTTGWRHRLTESWRALEKLVVIRRTDVNAQAFVTPAYAALLRERIQLALQETQLAVIQRQHALYQLTLKQAIDLIQQLFDVQQSDAAALLKQLQSLQSQHVEQKKVEISQSLLLVNQLLDTHEDNGSSLNVTPDVQNNETGAAHHD